MVVRFLQRQKSGHQMMEDAIGRAIPAAAEKWTPDDGGCDWSCDSCSGRKVDTIPAAAEKRTP
ncbi:MAG: hypothetical protein P4M11_10750, partial [Candidatus Pacebacteria bacterium]|nr:hypothetical protein [Candidatus Paceibacterota bacterium]